MKVVSNASPLIGLVRIGKLDLISKLFGALDIPSAVWDEVVIQGGTHPGVLEVKSTDWIKTHTVVNHPLVMALEQDLDAGEAEAIALALDAGADLLLMDEKLGRQSAHHMGIHCIGSVGVLRIAKRRGLIKAINPDLDALRDIAGFRLSETLYLQVLRDEGEE